ncbi:unnamed protein product [Fusarium venenatum]|uniref:Uncharacterized protein n=1 Tax=Fusarium venenatum TaxID=56646 RepID=A0A2L2TRA2_9HYPO|nr:uncharacterized protein FVRRES_02658 [Fusarium venenatum]CEI66146.1 unnamed protein product [Fusarium venenatum]
MDVRVPRIDQMSYKSVLTGNGLGRDISAQGQNDNPFFQWCGQLIEPNPSQYLGCADSFHPFAKSHEDYWLTRDICRKLGDFQTGKPLAVFCLICHEPLPRFAVRCGYCTDFRQKQPPDTLESRSCIICKGDTSSW